MRALALLVLLLVSCTKPEPEVTAPAAPPPPPKVHVSPPPVPPKPGPSRRFLVVEGHVTMDAKPVVAGAPIGETANIEVGKKSRAVISVQAGSAVEIRQNSRLTIGSSTRKKTSMKLLAGVLWSILPKGQADYEVVSPSAVAGVRGTTFFVDASTHGTTALCVCEGEVDLAPGGAKSHTIVSQHGHQGYLITGVGHHAKVKSLGKPRFDIASHPNTQRDILKALATAAPR